MIKRIAYFLLAIFFVFIGSGAFSQPGRGGTSHNISGKTTDKNSGQPLPYATVSLYRSADSSLVTGGIADSAGIFRLSAPAGGPYYLISSFMGFENALITNISVAGDDKKMNVGQIRLQPKVQLLKDVEVVGEKPDYLLSMDKKTYFVGKDIVAVGGTVTDLLRNVPSINIDMDNQITVRGSSDVKILIDGKPSALMGGDQSALNQIPVYSIEKIELITNPSAKYDAEGMGGILNIVTKKTGGEDMQGFINLTAGYYHDHSGSLQIRMNRGRIKSFIGYDAKYQKNSREMVSERQFFTDSSTYYMNYLSTTASDELSNNISGGVDWSVTEKFSAGLSGSYRYKPEIGERSTGFMRLDSAKNEEYFSDRSSTDESVKQNFDASLMMRKKFIRPGQLLSMDIFYSQGSDEQRQVSEGAIFTPDKSAQISITEKDFSLTQTPRQQGTVQADYAHPMKSKGKIETGIKSYMRQLNSNYSVLFYDTSESAYFEDSLFSSNLEFTEQVHAGYFSYSAAISKLQFMAGIRSEGTVISIMQALQDSVPYENSYIDFFPNLQVTYPFTEKLPVQFSYSRRITRPSYNQLDPSFNFSDPQNIHRGNPYLKPELTHSLELNFMPQIKGVQFQGSGYYKYSVDPVTRFRRQITEEVSQIAFENAAWRQSYGVEMTVSQKLKFMRYNASFNFYRINLDARNLLETALRDFYSWNARMNVTVPIKKYFDFMVSGFWQGPMQSAQGDIKPMYFADAGVRRDLGKSGEIAVRVSDLFNTKRFEINASDPTFIIHARVKRLSQRIYLSFSYRINNYAMAEKKMQREQAEEMMME
ncbi:MAG: TonB-dependent receptor [Bacteroidetes bacterium]|nr:TonB-dependent receptor [Bacteroidota bacterium]